MDKDNNIILLDIIAAIQHEIWSHWMEYLFSISILNSDGTYTIPSDKVSRWLRQLNTSYYELTEAEKESDRDQATKVLVAFKSIGML
jgi:hypothetical protein